MKRLVGTISWLMVALASAQDSVRPALESSYNAWRDAMIRKDAAGWQIIDVILAAFCRIRETNQAWRKYLGPVTC